MTDRKLTEAEMISYLELSVAIGSTAKIAPEEAKILLDLVNQQKAEIERLSHKCEDCAGCAQWKCDCSIIESEAVKKFAHFLIDNSTDGTISLSDLPDLVIQMTEERTE